MVRNKVKRYSKAYLLRRLRDVQVSQIDLAARAGVSQSFVSLVLARRSRLGPRTDAVWREVEKAIGPIVNPNL
jgi:predicted transcriptional regulator